MKLHKGEYVYTRRAAGVIGAALLISASLTGCGSGYAKTIDDIAEQAKFKAACEEAGGYVDYSGVNTLICVFGDDQ